ncbi:MAG TPA: ParB N-terminal domain-containing protein [Myxococcaceae bacterium]|nr:ParB N-terminal domain-containing protein [Myxococcaceae bacterium]
MPKSSRTARQVAKKRKAPVRRRKATVRGLPAGKLLEDVPEAARALAEAIAADGGTPIAAYRDPLGGHGVVFAALPLDKVQPTPYQRDLSEPHVRRLAGAMTRVDRFLDPLIAVRQDGMYWTPNGNHRLGAARFLGAQSVVALVLPEPELAFQILALNTEKAHNLKERSLEVIRMLRGLVETRKGTELDVAPLLEEPAFVTLGAAYEKRPRLSGGAYQSIVKRVDGFLDEPLGEALAIREERADAVLRLDDAVSAVVERLKSRGLTSPYLKAFVVARINYLRFVKTAPEFDEALEKLTRSAERFNVDRIRQEDVRASGPPDSADEG